MYMGKERTRIWDKFKAMEYKGMSATAMMAYYRAREWDGDTARLSIMSGYAEGTIKGMMNGKIKITDKMVKALGDLAWRRTKLSDIRKREEINRKMRMEQRA